MTSVKHFNLFSFISQHILQFYLFWICLISFYDFLPETRFSLKNNLNSIIIRSKIQLKLTYLNDKLHSTRDTYDMTNVTVVVFGKYSLLLLMMSLLLLLLLLSLLFKPILMIISKNDVPYSDFRFVTLYFCVKKRELYVDFSLYALCYAFVQIKPNGLCFANTDHG